MNDFFARKTFVVNQQFSIVANTYDVQGEEGYPIGQIKENLGFGQILLRLFVSKASLPFNLEVTDVNGQVLANLKRGFTFFLSKINVVNPAGIVVGTVKHKFSFLKPKFALMDANGNQFATIEGDWKAWDFTITDMNGNNIGSVNKKWNGLLKEFFTDSDKYFVNVSDSVTDENQRMTIITVATLIDMILKENNN